MKNEEEMKCTMCGYNKKTLIAVIVLLLIAGSAFYVGAKYEKSKLAKLGLLKNGQNEDTCKAKDLITGEITAITDNAITIKTSDGNIQNVSISVSMKNSKKGASTLAGLAVGQQVVVNGIKNIDGSFSAQSIKPAAATTQVK